MTSNSRKLPLPVRSTIPDHWDDDPSLQLGDLRSEVAKHRHHPSDDSPDFMLKAWQALERLGPECNPRARAEAMLDIARFFYLHDDSQLMLDSAASAVKTAAAGNHPTLEAEARWRRGTALRVSWDLVGAMQEFALALELAQHCGEVVIQAKILNCLGAALHDAGLYSEALQVFERSRKLFEERGDPLSAFVALNAATLALDMGDIETASRLASYAKATWRRKPETPDEHLWVVQGAWTYCELLIQSGRAKEALEVAQDAAATASASGIESGRLQAEILQVVAGYASQINTKEDLDNIIERARLRATNCYSDTLQTAIRTYEYLGETDRALGLHRDLAVLNKERKFDQIRRWLGRPSPEETANAEKRARLHLALDRLVTELVNTSVMQSLRSGYDHTRVFRVSRMAQLFAKSERRPESDIEQVALAAKLIDIGTIVISGDLLNKKRRLTTDELLIVSEHVHFGAEILLNTRLSLLEQCAAIVRFHHERWDGTGPCGLKGHEILELAQIVALCDCFDALTHDRPWRPAIPRSDALDALRACAGTHFEPNLLQRFVNFVEGEINNRDDWEVFLAADALENDFVRARKRIDDTVASSLTI